MQRRATAVDGHRDDGFAAQLDDGVGDRALQRMLRVPVCGGVPPVDDAGREHGRVLAGAVLGERGLGLPGPDPRDALVLVDRVVGSVLKIRGGQTGSREDARGGLAVERLPGVAGAGERELGVGEVEPRPDHGRRLDRFVGRPGEDGSGRVADGPLDGAVGGRDHDGAAVDALHEPTANDVSEDRCLGERGAREGLEGGVGHGGQCARGGMRTGRSARGSRTGPVSRVCGVEPVAPAVGCSRPARPGSGARWGQWGQAPTFWAAALVALRARGAALRAEVAVALVRAVVALAPF